MKKLCAALLPSFTEQHSEKMKGSVRGYWDPREGQQPFRLNPNEAGDSTIMLKRLLIGAVEILSFSQTNSKVIFQVLNLACQVPLCQACFTPYHN